MGQTDSHPLLFELTTDSLEADDSISFPQFRQLPKELRDTIWIQFFTRQRWITINVLQPNTDCPNIAVDEITHLGEVPYIIHQSGDRVTSYCANKEAYAQFQRTYRIRIPLPIRNRPYCFINPDQDVVHIPFDSGATALFLSAFLQDARVVDPKGMGLSTLSLDPRGIQSLLQLSQHNLTSPVRSSIGRSLFNLSVLFLFQSTKEGCFMWRSHPNSVPDMTDETWANRFMPILS
jgi:hypothetical protein